MSSTTTGKGKKKKDYEALNSAFMRIPRMHVLAARAFLNLGFREVYEIAGRCPDHCFSEAKKLLAELPDGMLAYMRMAVYYAENEHDACAQKMHPSYWEG